MVPYSERRHRIHGLELPHVKEAVHTELLRRLETREDLLSTSILFRFWYRIETHCARARRQPDGSIQDTIIYRKESKPRLEYRDVLVPRDYPLARARSQELLAQLSMEQV